MIIGRKDISIESIIRHTSSIDELKEYSIECVPSMFRHVRAICDNQLYYMLLLLKKSNLSYDKKRELSEAFIGLCPTGYTDNVVPIDVLMRKVSIDKLRLYYRKEHKSNG